MIMSPGLRKLALAAHVTSSVGWLGAVAAFSALAVVSLTSPEVQRVRAADLAMDWCTWFVVVPFCVASTLTGLISSLGTPWGLFRHYWVLVKLLLTVPAATLLLVHLEPIGLLAREAAKSVTALSGAELHGIRNLLVTAGTGGVLVLLGLTTISFFKPRGMTPYGWRKQREQRSTLPP
jgi:hypothetical protein